MKIFDVETILNSYSKNVGQYVCIEGYYDGKGIKKNNSDRASIAADNDEHFYSTISQLLKKIEMDNYTGSIRVIGKLGVGMTSKANIGQVIKIDILDNDGKFVNSATVNSDSIPKELRDQI